MLALWAHRGSGVTMHETATARAARQASGVPYENSIAAFVQAFTQQHAKGVELDVINTADAIPVVLHDESLQKHFVEKTAADGVVEDYPLHVLKTFDMGDPGTKVSSLEEVVTAIAPFYGGKPAFGLNVELKGKGTAATAYQVMQAMWQAGLVDKQQTIFSSFDHGELRALRALSAEAKLGALYEPFSLQETDIYRHPAMRYMDKIHKELQLFSHHVVWDDVIGRDDVRNHAKQQGAQLVAWTYKEQNPQQNRQKIQALLEKERVYPLHALITDYPGEMRDVINSIILE